MSSVFDKLNLKPGERRFVVIAGLVVFVVLNAFFVWPEFMEWRKVQQRKKNAEESLRQFQREVDKTTGYQSRLAELQRAGAAIGSEDQALKLSSTVYSQAALSGIQVNTYTPVLKTIGGGKTNQFFDEQSGTIQLIGEEKSLVDFLYNLGSGGSMIRVRSMTLNPDPARMRLQGSMTLVASYQRTAAKTAPAATAPRAAAAASGAPKQSINTTLKPATNAPAAKEGWLSRLWPFGKKSATPAPTTPPTAPAKTTNAPPKK
jgi:hypothetical protein